MKARTFFQFAGPSMAMMFTLMALPLCITFFLSMRNCTLAMETVTLTQSGPFGTEEVVSQRAKVGADGQAIESCQFVGLQYFRGVLGLDQNQSSAGDTRADAKPNNEFLVALRFTLFYVVLTTPFILVIGFLLALGVNRASKRVKGLFITASLLPFIITPLVGALSIKWLFRDNGLIPHLLGLVGIQLHWMAQAWSAQLLIILYGIWHVVPFSFIVLYAGLQSVPQEAIEAAHIDGATRWQTLRYVTIPSLMPLLVFITMIHVMDAYRVFEPVLVLTQGAFTTSVQYLTYSILLQENNPYKASASSVLTLLGILVLLIPLLRKTWAEHKGEKV